MKHKHLGSIAKRTGKCCVCGEKGKYGVWGRYYCGKCFEEHYKKKPRPESEGKGHSGMLALPDNILQQKLQQTYLLPQSFDYPVLIYVPKGNKVFASLYLSHYPQSKGIVGRSFNYFVIWKQRIAGIIGGNSPPYSVKAVDEYFNVTKENRSDMLLYLMNNEVFRIIKSDKNLATRTLKAFRKQIQKDHKKKYGYGLVGLLTFVEPPLTGNIYKADNWTYVGMTKGYGTTRRGKRWFDRKWIKKKPKHIFVKKLKP